jgi:hypothetical protein
MKAKIEVYYVAHAYEGEPDNLADAKRILRMLQIIDQKSVYISPLTTFSHVKYNEIGYDAEMALCLALLARCDRLIVTGDYISEGVKIEIRYAQEHNIPIEYIGSQEGV